jgi:hypothetical protein
VTPTPHSPRTVLLAVSTELLPQAKTAVGLLGGRITGSQPADPSDSAAEVTDLQVEMPDAPPGAARFDIQLTREQPPGQPASVWISGLTYLDAEHRVIETYLDAEHRVIETREVRVTVPITLDQIPEPLRGARRR